MCPWHIATSRFDWSVIKTWINLKMQINIAEQPIRLMHLCQDTLSLDSVTRRWRWNSSCPRSAPQLTWNWRLCGGWRALNEGTQRHHSEVAFRSNLTKRHEWAETCAASEGPRDPETAPRKYPVQFNCLLCVFTQIHAWSHPRALMQGLGGVNSSPAPVSLSDCGRWVSCVVPAPSKSSSGRKEQGGSLPEHPCDSLPPLSPSPLWETTRAKGKK